MMITIICIHYPTLLYNILFLLNDCSECIQTWHYDVRNKEGSRRRTNRTKNPTSHPFREYLKKQFFVFSVDEGIYVEKRIYGLDISFEKKDST